MRLVKPRALSPGDTIGIVACSEPIRKNDFLRGVAVLKQLGFRIREGKHLFSRRCDYITASDEKRAEDINEMFRNPEIAGIMAAQGGTSANRLLPLLDYDLIARNPKVFCGYSDSTVLSLAFLRKAKLVTFHGPNLAHLGAEPLNPKSFFKMVTRSLPGKLLAHTKWKILRSGPVVTGRLVGGNLQRIVDTLATPYFPDIRRGILFWEEVGEDPADIDRSLHTLRNAGVFEKIRGMVVGKLTNCEPTKKSEYQNYLTITETILEATAGCSFPILADVDFGHHVPQLTLPVGIRVRLDAAKRSLALIERPVRWR